MGDVVTTAHAQLRSFARGDRWPLCVRQPMTEAARQVAEQFDDAAQQRDAATLGIWAFLATEVLFFGVLFAAYTVLRLMWPDAFSSGSRHTDLTLGTVETAVLL